MMWITLLNPNMWMSTNAQPLDVGSAPVNGTSSACGWNRDNLSTRISTEIEPQRENPHLGNVSSPCPYMGVRKKGVVRQRNDFSTSKGTYPQIIASYPHFTCLGDRTSFLVMP
jgi:hypothetical protein